LLNDIDSNTEMEARNIYGISAATATTGHGVPLWAGLRQYLLRLIYDCYIERESGSKSRVRALTRDPTRIRIADPVTRDPETRFHLWYAVSYSMLLCKQTRTVFS